jgi:hypothetical protein
MTVINRFVETFLSRPEDLRHAPKRVQIEWDRGMDDCPGSKCDLTHLLRMRAHNAGVGFKFIPDKLAMGWDLREDICWYCIENHRGEELGDDDHFNPYEEVGCLCPPEDLDYDELEPYQYSLIRRTDILHNVISNANERWLDDVREGILTVQCVFGKEGEPVTFRILCEGRFCVSDTENDASNHAREAWKLLEMWGIFDLPSQDEMSFVVAFESDTKTKKGGYEMVYSEMREVRVAKSVSGAK